MSGLVNVSDLDTNSQDERSARTVNAANRNPVVERTVTGCRLWPILALALGIIQRWFQCAAVVLA